MTVRQRVYERAGGYCERCGAGLGESWALHHRLLRSAGGSDDLSNLTALCHPCHNLGTRSVHLNPAQSYKTGWLIRRGATPQDTPLVYSDGTAILLNDNGGITQAGDE